MDRLLAQMAAPFFLVLMLAIAKPVGHLIERLIPEGRVKRFLTKPRSNRSEMMERADAAMFRFLARLVRAGASHLNMRNIRKVRRK